MTRGSSVLCYSYIAGHRYYFPLFELITINYHAEKQRKQKFNQGENVTTSALRPLKAPLV